MNIRTIISCEAVHYRNKVGFKAIITITNQNESKYCDKSLHKYILCFTSYI